MVDFREIVECELVKRAMEVAAAGRHSLLLYGPHDHGKTLCLDAMAGLTDVDNVGPIQDWTAAGRRKLVARLDKRDRLIVGEVIPCPCGNYLDPYEICRCSASTIRRYRDRLQDAVRSFDMMVGVKRPSPEIMAKGTPYNGEDTATVKARVERAATVTAEYQLSTDSETLLAQAIRQLHLTPKQSETARAVGATSARLDQSARDIEAFHVSEAIQYVSALNTTWQNLGG